MARWWNSMRRRSLYERSRTARPTLLRQKDLEYSEYGEDSTRNGRISHMSRGGDADCIKERYVRVAAIIIATIDGAKSNCD
jgi:hypothetical protein